MNTTNTIHANGIITGDTRIIPIRPANQVKAVTKMENGDLRVELHSGKTFSLSKDDELFQAFLIWTVLNKGF